MIVLKVMWLSACAFVLMLTLYLFDPETGRDADLILAYGMLALAFPASLIMAGALALLANATSLVDVHYGALALVVVWVLFVGAGYLQWFKCLPWVLRRLRSERAGRGKAVH